ncbi:MAG TPA: DUF3149 domain-containing protein [Chitinolyticbacter sp.]|nr:DUF3149 domain-containing protein [Chitinolyticbacter sp.]
MLAPVPSLETTVENTPLETLFTSHIGLLSLFTIGFIVAMAGYLCLYVRRHVKEDTAAHERELNRQ